MPGRSLTRKGGEAAVAPMGPPQLQPRSAATGDNRGVGASLDFDAVYREHGRTVARWAARLGGPGITVEDVVQDVFLVVSRRLHEFRGEAKLATWLFGITDRTVRNWRRRQRWRRLMRQLGNRI